MRSAKKPQALLSNKKSYKNTKIKNEKIKPILGQLKNVGKQIGKRWKIFCSFANPQPGRFWISFILDHCETEFCLLFFERR